VNPVFPAAMAYLSWIFSGSDRMIHRITEPGSEANTAQMQTPSICHVF
jgi:hypothetical protein